MIELDLSFSSLVYDVLLKFERPPATFSDPSKTTSVVSQTLSNTSLESKKTFSYTFEKLPKRFSDIEKEFLKILYTTNNIVQLYKFAKQLSSTVKANDLYELSNLFQVVLLMKHPNSHLKKQLGYEYGNLAMLDLQECTCPHAIRDDMDDSAIAKRVKIENTVLRHLEKFKRDDSFVYLSIGSGGCLSDWMILSQMTLTGFKQVDVHLVDILYGPTKYTDYAMRMKDFFEQFPSLQFRVFYYSSLAEFCGKQIPCDIALAIDLDCADHGGPQKILFKPNGISLYTKLEPSWDNSQATTRLTNKNFK